MAYARSGLRLLRGPVHDVTRDGPNIWLYVSADAIATIDNSNYFAGNGVGGDLPMKVNDIVIADGNGVREVGAVSEVTGTGATVVFPISLSGGAVIAFP